MSTSSAASARSSRLRGASHRVSCRRAIWLADVASAPAWGAFGSQGVRAYAQNRRHDRDCAERPRQPTEVSAGPARLSSRPSSTVGRPPHLKFAEHLKEVVVLPRGFEAEVGVSGDVEPDRATTSFTPACTGDGKMVLPAADSHWPKNGDHQPLTDRFHASMSTRLGGRSSPPAVSLPCARREEQPCPTPARKVTVGEPRPVNGPITFVV